MTIAHKPSKPGNTSKKPIRATAADIAAEVERQLGEQSIPAIYRRILGDRTRRYELRAPKKASTVEILHTLLGIELKVGRRRLLCPDLATVRYLSVFARLGCDFVAVPYDITRISSIADELETRLHQTLLLVADLCSGRGDHFKRSAIGRTMAQIRDEITALGAGDQFPQFNHRNRKRRE
jgi:hypothetical protein